MDLNNGAENEPVRKFLSPRQAVIGAVALFELHTKEEELADMALRASIPYGPDEPEGTDRLRREWYGFVHAGIAWALLDKAPAEAVSGYLGGTLEIMERFAGYEREEAEQFVASTLTDYMRLISTGEQRQCPVRLLSHVLGEDFTEYLSNDQIAFVAGMMAITLCNILDTLDRYSFLEGEDGPRTLMPKE